MTDHDVWVIMPTANEDNCRAHIPMWHDMGYRVAVLQDRVRFDCDADRVLRVAAYPGWPGSVNRLFRDAVPNDVQIVVAPGDDMRPDPWRRASEIAEQFLDHFEGTFGVMQPHGDAFEETQQFCGSPWMGRSWMERMYAGAGGMCDAYVHHFADDELYWVSRCHGVLWTRDDLTQYHDHFRRRGEDAPAYWKDSAAANDRQDTLTFIARAAAGFPGHGAADRAGRFDSDVFRTEYRGRAETYWRTHHAPPAKADNAAERLDATLRTCASEGVRRVALFGAGRYLQRAAPALFDPPVEVLAIIDEKQALRGLRRIGLPIVTPLDAEGMRLDAVILCTDTHASAMRHACDGLARLGVRILTPERDGHDSMETAA